MDKQVLYDTLPERLSRSTPAIITQFHLPKNEELFTKNKMTIDFYEKVGFSVTLNNLIQPYGLYLTFSSNPNDTIVIKEDFLYREEQGFLDIIEGAVRSTPETGTPWRVTYRDYPPILFQGNLILCTRLTEAAVRKKRKLDFLSACCLFI